LSKLTRRSAIIAAGALAASSASAQGVTQPGFRAWTRPQGETPLPLDTHVNTGDGVVTLREWLGGRPALLALWATWCAPCVAEKPAQARLARRLEASNARARILALQAYDDVDLRLGRHVLTVLGAQTLVNGAAMRDAERAFVRLLGGGRDGARTPLPQHLLIDSAGRELGRAAGLMRGRDGGYTYFEDEATFEFLSSLT
jgi:thiol-disulfide isomerase/thioredoxin